MGEGPAIGALPWVPIQTSNLARMRVTVWASIEPGGEFEDCLMKGTPTSRPVVAEAQ